MERGEDRKGKRGEDGRVAGMERERGQEGEFLQQLQTYCDTPLTLSRLFLLIIIQYHIHYCLVDVVMTIITITRSHGYQWRCHSFTRQLLMQSLDLLPADERRLSITHLF
jgi:hypothetical protein